MIAHPLTDADLAQRTDITTREDIDTLTAFWAWQLLGEQG